MRVLNGRARVTGCTRSQVLIEMLEREFEGAIGCDYFSAYRKYMEDFNVLVQFCFAHLIRDIKSLTKQPDEQTQAYGKKLLAAVKRMLRLPETETRVPPDPPRFAAIYPALHPL